MKISKSNTINYLNYSHQLLKKGKIMYSKEHSNYSQPCEFTIPIKLNIPIEINPTLSVNPVAQVKQDLPVFLHPELYLEPKVLAQPAECQYLPSQPYRN
jgi:hypothetical protein